MLLSRLIEDYTKHNIKILNDCEVDRFYLLGKIKPADLQIKLFTFVENIKYMDDVIKSGVSGILCTEETADAVCGISDIGIAVTDNPRIAFFELYNRFVDMNVTPPVKTHIGENARIHPSVIIPENNVHIGNGAHIGAYTVIEEGVHIGDNVFIEPACRVGMSAFYHIYSGEDHVFVKSSGTLRIEDNVSIHSGTSLEKGAMGGETYIGNDVSIDNNVLVGHDSILEDNVRVAGGSTIAGGVFIGKKTQLGVGVSIAPNVHIGKGSQISVGAAVTKEVPDGVRYSGNFAIEHSAFLKDLKKRLKEAQL